MTMRVRIATMLLSIASLALAPATSEAQKRQRDRITREEIMGSAHRDMDMFQVIRGLRPHFLQPPKGTRSAMGATYTAPVALYVDEKKDIGLEALRSMSPRNVEDVRYLEPSASLARFGPMVNGGAILVKLYRGPSGPDSTKSP